MAGFQDRPSLIRAKAWNRAPTIVNAVKSARQRARLRDTFKKKTYATYREYSENPLPSIVRSYVEAEIAISPDGNFDPEVFAGVMDELLAKVAVID